jgi:hypothetical protein
MSFSIQIKWKPENQEGLKKNRWGIDVLPEFREVLGQFLKKHIEREKKTGEEKLINLQISPYYSERNLDQNALMHSLYAIEAECLNVGMGASRQYEISPWDIYEKDLKEYCPKMETEVSAEFLSMYQLKFRHTHILERSADKVKIQVWKTTSHFHMKEMAYWIDRIVNRIGEYGVPLDLQGEMKTKWISWKKYLNAVKIVLHTEDKCTKEEYKNKVPLCEASGIWLGQGGEVAHIRAVGMGGKEEPSKDHPENWFHLQGEIHRGLIHGKGWKSFLKEYPWLKYKYKIANLMVEKKCPECGGVFAGSTCTTCEEIGMF